jgi:CMP-N,N'-diacetyllegionaminic acid synthase
MRIAIIPARGGSKGIKNKNLVEFRGKPLISWVLDTALKSELFDKVIVSTESNNIASYVKKNFLEVLVIKRPLEIATDLSVSEDAVYHAVENIEKLFSCVVDQVLFIQATSPFTTINDLERLVDKLNNNDSVAFYTEDYGYHFDIDDMYSPRLPRQTREPKKKEAGNAWAFNGQKFKVCKSRLFGKIGLVKISNLRAFEIDEYIDLKVGEIMGTVIDK